MHASVWGPPLWKAIFSAAWHVDDETVDILREVLLELLPVLLPCVTCRENYRKHVPAVHRQSKSRLRSPDEVMRWCWYMKNEVNKVTHHTSLPYDELVERYTFHKGILDEVEFADVLVIMALNARATKQDEAFVHFCRAMSEVLVLPHDSALAMSLNAVQAPVVNSAVRCACATRMQHGHATLNITHYRRTFKA